MKRTSRLSVASILAVGALALSACSSSGGSGAAASPTSATPAASGDASASASAPAGGEFTAPGADDKGGENNPVKIGVVGASGPQWADYEAAAAAEGIHIEIIDFTDYQQPNPATTVGDLDLNQFQHILFLAQYNLEAGEDLQPIGSTAIYPLGLYSKQYDSVDAIPDGAQIAIPNDGTNQSRALGVLASAGLITLKDGTPALTAGPEDIDEGASKATVVPVSADQTARNLDDPSIAAAVINNDYVDVTGLDPKDAIAQDDPSSPSAKPFINILVTTADQVDNPVYLKLAELLHDPTVEAALEENSGGTRVLVDETAEALQGYLTDAEAELAADQ